MLTFIVNPSSRQNYGAKMWQLVQEELQKEGKEEHRDYEAYLTTREEHADEIAARLTKDQTGKSVTLIVLGGDGTLNEVMNGVNPDCDLILGYMKTGSGNDFARGLHLPEKPEENIKTVLHPSFYRKLDCGTAVTDEGERRFVVSAGIGYDAAVCHELLYSRVRKVLSRVHLEKLGYLLVGIEQMLRSKPLNGTLIIDDGAERITLAKGRFVSAHILPYEGGGFCFAPSADPSDGMLELCVINECGKFRFFLTLLMAVIKKHEKMKTVRIIRCKKAEVQLADAFPIHADGESAGVRNHVTFCDNGDTFRLITEGRP